jgi:hypothetical protein
MRVIRSASISSPQISTAFAFVDIHHPIFGQGEHGWLFALNFKIVLGNQDHLPIGKCAQRF